LTYQTLGVAQCRNPVTSIDQESFHQRVEERLTAKPPRRWWMGLLLGLALITTLLGGALAILLWTSWGRAHVCKRIASAITQEIAGRLEVDRFEELSLGHVRARGIRIFAPDGKLAIGADTATITFDLRDYLAGDYGWERAEITNGKVYVTEDERGKINMEETFRGRERRSEPKRVPTERSENAESELDLRSMVTSNALLVISGGSLPRMRLTNLYGIMRVHVRRDGSVELRFDEFRGFFARGLPTGTLKFHDVAGQVVPSHDKLLHFDGRGTTQGAAVAFGLDIFTEPKKRVEIDARFPELTPAAAPTLGVATWSKLSPSLDVEVEFGNASDPSNAAH
jgi:hypothetical protein